MIQEYIQTPPPNERWYIVYQSDMSVVPRYGELTNAECDLGYNYDTSELFVDKEIWIARLLELGIEYIGDEEI